MDNYSLQFTIEDFGSYLHGKNLIRNNGEFVRLTFEVAPATVSVSFSAIEEIIKRQLEHWQVSLSYDQIVERILAVACEGINFRDIKGSEYIGDDYRRLRQVFDMYKYERTSFAVTRRQYSYVFGEKLCMYSIQFFEDYKRVIVNFRSCDYIKKFPFDLLMVKALCELYKFDITRIFCNFGSLHYYDADTWKL